MILLCAWLKPFKGSRPSRAGCPETHPFPAEGQPVLLALPCLLLFARDLEAL
jgi:hypothetical protein